MVVTRSIFSLGWISFALSVVLSASGYAQPETSPEPREGLAEAPCSPLPTGSPELAAAGRCLDAPAPLKVPEPERDLYEVEATANEITSVTKGICRVLAGVEFEKVVPYFTPDAQSNPGNISRCPT